METMYGGADTFGGVPPADASDPTTYAEADVLVIGAPFDGGTSHRPGARFGPHAIRTTDYLPLNGSRPHLDLGVDSLRDQRVVDGGDVLMPSGEIERSLARLEEVVAAAAGTGVFVVVLGGDHTTALASLKGVAAQGTGRLGLLYFDAHSDSAPLHFGSPLGHGTWVRRLVEAGVVPRERIVQIGQRNVGFSSEAGRSELGVRTYGMTEIVHRGLGACIDEAVANLVDSCDRVYISIDVDVVDPAYAPGTGTPEPGGLTSRDLLDAVVRCVQALPVVAMDVVEVCPPYDAPGQITARLANRVVLEALAGTCRRRRSEGKALRSARLSTDDFPERVGAALRRAEAIGFEWSCAPEVGRLLAMLAAGVPPRGRILEIGAGVGVGTAWLVHGLDGRDDVELFTVEADHDRAALVAGSRWPDWVTIVNGDVLSLLGDLGTFDLVFADAEAGKFDGLERTLAALRPGGRIVMDDMGAPNGRSAGAERMAAVCDTFGVTYGTDGPETRTATRSRLVANPDLVAVELQWSSGVIVATRRGVPSGAA